MDIRARETSGALQQDQFQGHWHAQYYSPSGADGLGSDGRLLSTTNNSVVDSSGNANRGPISDSSNGTPRDGAETRPKNVSATFYMRIL